MAPAIPRPATSTAARVASPILFAIAAAVVVLTLRGLTLFADNADVVDLAVSIEKGATPDAGYLARFVARNGLDRASSDCGDAFTRASLTVNLAALEAATTRNDTALVDAAEGNATRAAERRLGCNPLDGNAWLRYAMVEARGKAPAASVARDLRLSAWTTPSEAWILEPRLAFATGLNPAGVSGFETEYADDLRRFALYEPPGQVAAAYAETAPQVRASLRALIDIQLDARRTAIVAEIDRLGLDFGRP